MPGEKDRVVIVGAGPVGLTAALALIRRGIPVVLLASEPELVMELRGSTFHHRHSTCSMSSASYRG